MPLTKLKPVDLSRDEDIHGRISYSKNIYSPIVKNTDWDRQVQSEPYDNNPFNPSKVNQHLSHYNGFGQEDNSYERKVTTTSEMLSQYYQRDKTFEKRTEHKLINIYTCNNAVTNPITNKICAPDFNTTMQDSYKAPHPLVGLGDVYLRKIPFMKYRRIKQVDPRMSQYKFFDEEYLQAAGKFKDCAN